MFVRWLPEERALCDRGSHKLQHTHINTSQPAYMMMSQCHAAGYIVFHRKLIKMGSFTFTIPKWHSSACASAPNCLSGCRSLGPTITFHSLRCRPARRTVLMHHHTTHHTHKHTLHGAPCGATATASLVCHERSELHFIWRTEHLIIYIFLAILKAISNCAILFECVRLLSLFPVAQLHRAIHYYTCMYIL